MKLLNIKIISDSVRQLLTNKASLRELQDKKEQLESQLGRAKVLLKASTAEEAIKSLKESERVIQELISKIEKEVENRTTSKNDPRKMKEEDFITKYQKPYEAIKMQHAKRKINKNEIAKFFNNYIKSIQEDKLKFTSGQTEKLKTWKLELRDIYGLLNSPVNESLKNIIISNAIDKVSDTDEGDGDNIIKEDAEQEEQQKLIEKMSKTGILTPKEKARLETLKEINYKKKMQDKSNYYQVDFDNENEKFGS